jgi:hypothetical protein
MELNATMISNVTEAPAIVTPDHSSDETFLGGLELPAPALVGQSNLVPHPNYFISWAREVSSKQKESFYNRVQPDDDTDRHIQNLLDRAIKTLSQTDLSSTTSLPIPFSSWMGMDDLGRRKCFRDSIKQKLESKSVSFWKASLEDGQLIFTKMTSTEINKIILSRITSKARQSKKKRDHCEISNSFSVDTIRGRATREEDLSQATTAVISTTPFTIDSQSRDAIILRKAFAFLFLITH